MNIRLTFRSLAAAGLLAASVVAADDQLDISDYPLFAGVEIPSQVMINLSNDNQLYFNAYPEYADLTGDGSPELGYNHEFDYTGYFDAYKCYSYSSSSGRFVPASETDDKYCSGNWSGNFLNWLSMARIDAVRGILYGGKRITDSEDLTVLERTYLPNDAHSWVRYYDGEDIQSLTPFSLPEAPTSVSSTGISIPDPPRGERNDDDYRRTFRMEGWSEHAQVAEGDQLEIESINLANEIVMRGVVIDVDNVTNGVDVEVQVTSTESEGLVIDSHGPWRITNRTRRGVSFCNTTEASSGASQDVDDPPLIRVARGNYSLWTANERWQCRWAEDERLTGHPDMRVGGNSFSNGNDITASGLWANSENPWSQHVGLGEKDYNVRVEVCRDGLIGEENCRQYPNGSYKPVGLLQEFGEDRSGSLRFGLITGSYTNNLSGGVLRKNISTFDDEVDPQTGQFRIPDSNESIVRTIDALRLYGYNQGSGVYSGEGDACGVGVRKSDMQDGKCMNWGNPQAEILAESLRYFAGLAPNSDFDVSGTDKLDGLLGAEWQDSLSEDRWCTALNVIQFNASVPSFDDNADDAIGGLPGIDNVSSFTNTVGAGEGINGSQVFFGGDDRLCTAKNAGSLSDVRGLCPEAPNQLGTYDIAGLAHYGYTTDLRPDFQGEQFVRMFGVSLAPAVPRIEIPRPGEDEPAVVILPACENQGDGGLRCALADFRIIEQDIEQGTGSFFIQWDVHEWGSDFDMDMNGVLSYEITNSEVEVTTDAWSVSSSRSTGFGYIISGTNQDGYHAHSGINGYDYTDPTGALGCNNCRVTNAPTSHTYQLGGDVAELLREPLFFAAKWAGYDKSMDFPNDPDSWDSNGDGMPDNYSFATDPGALREALAATFELILEEGSATSLTSDSTRLEQGGLIYQASFDTDDWAGNVIARDPLEDNEIKWQAAQELDGQSLEQRRDRVFTFDPEASGGTGVAFDSEFTRERLAQAYPDEPEDSFLDALVDYLIGERDNEERFGGPFRDRQTRLGDIVNSQIVFSGERDEGWRRLGASQAGESYGEFVADKEDRGVVFVGANDGMLHAFDAEDGTPHFSFVPSEVIENLADYASPSYGHRFFVDGQIAVADAYWGGSWRTVLVGAMGAGGKGVFALDVTNPESFNPSTDVLWEFGPDSDPYGEYAGHVFGSPTITRMENGDFVALFGNGYNSEENVAALVGIRLSDGEPIRQPVEVDIQGQEPDTNGLASPGLWLETGQARHVERAYAGDLTGRMWRFEFSEGSFDLSSAFNRGLLYHAVKGSGNNAEGQPITTNPTLSASARGGLKVLFGTGKLIENNDVLPSDTPLMQTFYALRDVNESISNNQLGEVILRESTDPDFPDAREVEVESEGSRGWAMDLATEEQGADGERVVARAGVLFGRVIFSTYQPVPDPCLGGGIARIYVANLNTGAGALDGCVNCGGSVIEGSGAPISPPTIIRPPVTPTPPGDDDEPGFPGPPDDDDPQPIPLPPDDDFGSREAWCSSFGYISPVTQEFVSLGNLCDGRQIWREGR